MNENAITTTPSEQAAVTQPAAPSSSVPEDYEELKQFRATYQPALEAIAPHWEDIRPIIEDEAERNYWRSARETRQAIQERQKPKLTPELELIRDEFRGELGPVVEFVKNQQQERQRQTEAAQKQSLDTNYAYAQRLVAERPELGEHNFAGINMLAQLAYRDGRSLEDTWKEYGSMFAARVEKATPPPSLHGGAASPGIPGPSTQPRITSRKGLRERLAANIKAGSR